ncbi:integrase-like protein, partial [Salipiger aestuarii]
RYAMEHIFDRVCSEHGIEHRLAKVNHPWTNGQVERMNRTLKEATVKRYHLRHTLNSKPTSATSSQPTIMRVASRRGRA